MELQFTQIKNISFGILKCFNAFEHKEIALRGWKLLRASLGHSVRASEYAIMDLESPQIQPDTIFEGWNGPSFLEVLAKVGMPEESVRDSLVNRILKGDLSFLGDNAYIYSGPIQWGGLSGYPKWPLVQRHKLPVGKSGRTYGDPKQTWNLNKLFHWPLLAENISRTGNANAAKRLEEEVAGWLEQNPFELGINWASELEVAERALNWYLTVSWLIPNSILNDRVWRIMLSALASHGAYLARHLTVYAYNHCIGEASVLLLISRIIHKSTVAEKWRQRAVSVLLDRVLRLISSDGYYREKSPAYAFLVFQYLTIALWCMKPTGKERCKIKSRRDALGKKLLRLRFETGRLPSLGDDDDARLLEFKPRHGRMHEHISFIDLISSAAIVGRQRADYVKGYEISMLRSGELEVSLNVDNLPIAKKVAPHIHDDILQVSLLCRGEPILIDPGTFSYSINPAKRDWYRGAISHNAPVISAKPTSEPWSHFRWNRIGRGASLGVKTSGQAVATSARRRDDAVRRHCVLWPGGMVLIDQIKTSLQLHTIKWLFHFGGGKIMTSPEGWSVANTTGDCEFRIGCSAAGDLNILGTKVVHCPWSPRYGVEKSGYGISASALNKDKGWMIWCFIRNRIHQQEIVLEPESRVQGRAVWRQEKETPLFSWQIRGGRFFLNIPGADSARFEWV